MAVLWIKKLFIYYNGELVFIFNYSNKFLTFLKILTTVQNDRFSSLFSSNEDSADFKSLSSSSEYLSVILFTSLMNSSLVERLCTQNVSKGVLSSSWIHMIASQQSLDTAFCSLLENSW